MLTRMTENFTALPPSRRQLLHVLAGAAEADKRRLALAHQAGYPHGESARDGGQRA